MHTYPLYFIAGLLIAVLARPCGAISFSKEIGKHELYAEFDDPYYISTGLYFSLDKNGIPTLDTIDEWPVYRVLIGNWYAPNCFVLEAGAAPVPLAGVGIKHWAPNYYDKARLGDVNLVNAMTESVDFKEPGALSAFLGRMLYFKNAASAIQGTATIGLLTSYGCYHIHNNVLLADHWGEFEAKIKIDKRGSERRYGTSYRIGSRLHSNADIKDEFYLSLKRDRTDFAAKGFSLIQNTNAQIRCDMSFKPLQVLSVFAEAGKKIPFQINKHAYALGLSLGITWTAHCAYSGGYADGFIPNRFSPIIRPLLTF